MLSWSFEKVRPFFLASQLSPKTLFVIGTFLQVSFTSEFVADPPLLVPSWQGNGCDDCTEFSSGFPRGGGAYVNVSSEASMGEWEEQAVLQAKDRRSGDRFGSTVALDQVKH